jgi:hypothetical protein
MHFLVRVAVLAVVGTVGYSPPGATFGQTVEPPWRAPETGPGELRRPVRG